MKTVHPPGKQQVPRKQSGTWTLPLCPVSLVRPFTQRLLQFPSTITGLFADSTCHPSWSSDFALPLYLFSLLPTGLTPGTHPKLHHRLLCSSRILPQCTALRGTHGQPPLPSIMPMKESGINTLLSRPRATRQKSPARSETDPPGVEQLSCLSSTVPLLRPRWHRTPQAKARVQVSQLQTPTSTFLSHSLTHGC